ncbi:MAG: sodium/solute symporter [Kiritimatiellae bacterium]|nr:sodium/solute symporter [Kiritimatiellia bacterium]
MGIVDLVVFLVFIGTVVGVGLWKSKSAHSEEGGAADYFLAGRGLKWWLIGISLIAANISAEQFVGMSGQAASYLGLAIASYEWMAAVTLVLVAFAFLPYFLKTGIFTIPGFLEHRYNHLARSIMAVFMMFILVGVSLCGVIYAGALPMRDLLMEAGINVSLTICCWIMGVLAAGYVASGGLKACAWADLIQGTALIVGGVLITVLAFQALGVADISTLTAGVGATAAAAKDSAVAVTDSMGGMQRFITLNSDKLHMFLPKADPIIPWTALCLGLWIPNIYYWGLNQYITQRTLGSSSLAEGQKGIVFAAALKLIIPFIIVFPGLIAFNLYRPEMVQKAELDFLNTFEKSAAAVETSGNYLTFTALDSWKAANPLKAAEIDAYNKLVTEKASASGSKTAVKVQSEYKSDSALGLLIARLCMGRKGLFGFIVAALLGAIVSSLAAVLNAASTIFSIDIYNSYINKAASQKQLVGVGRVCVGVFVVVGCVVAPLLDDPKFGGIFTYIQEFQGYVSPGVLAVFVFGLLNRTAAGVTGVIGLLLNPVLYFLLKTFCPQIDFLNRMAICLVIVLAVMFVVGLFSRLPQPVVFKSNTHLDMQPSRGAKICGIAVVIVTAILYIIFR